MNTQAEVYISNARAAGQSDEQIKQSLLQSGWTEIQINEAFGVPVSPNFAPAPPPAPFPIVHGELLDKKTKDTIIWSVVGYFARSLIVGFATALGAYLFLASTVSVYGVVVSSYRPGFYFNFGSVIINSIIGGLIFGFILAKFYGKVQEINHKFFGGWFNNLYRLIFYPALIAGVLSLLLAGSFSFLGGQFFLYLLVIIVGDLVGSYIFAKLMVNKVGQYYV